MYLGSNQTWGKQPVCTTWHWDIIKEVDTTQEAKKSKDKDKEAVKVATADKGMDAGAWERQHLLQTTLRTHNMLVDVAQSKHLVEYPWQGVTRQQQGNQHSQTL